jgi:hypothetical protein
MQVTILLDEQSEMYAETKRAIIEQRLSTALLLLLQELRADDLKRGMVIGKGISPVASIESFDKHAERARWHEETFLHNEEIIKQMERNRTLGSMVLPKEH